MIFHPDVTTVPEEEEDENVAEIPKSATRFNGRRERVRGLGVKGVHNRVTVSNNLSTKTYKNSVGSRPSLVSLITRSVESSNEKNGPARPSSSQSSTPTLSTSRSSPPESVISTPSRFSFILDNVDEEDEDITTYSANLARFKAERAERTAELGLSVFDEDFEPGPVEVTKLEELQTRESESRRNSTLSLGRDMRVYWGGGSSPDSKLVRSPSKSSKRSSIDSNSSSSSNSTDRVGKEALKEWWDNLGTASVPKKEKVFVNPEVDFTMAANVLEVMLNAEYKRSINHPRVGKRTSSRRAVSTAC